MVIEIIFMANKSHSIEIAPATWLIVPRWYWASWRNRQKDNIDVRTDKNVVGVYCRYASRRMCIQWMCFKFYIGLWQLTEVGEIYPKDWDYTKVSDEENNARFKRLVETGYFS